jgi:hypothetical protein
MSDDEASTSEDGPLPKPVALLALHDVTELMFSTLRRWFAVPDEVMLDLTDIDAVVREMGDPVMIAALAMRKLQALRLLALPGVRTTTDVVITVVQDLDRALVQAPVMRLRLAAETTDWDAELAAINHPSAQPAPDAADADDPEVDEFRLLHARLHEALLAVVEASDGEIREFI